MIQRVNDNISIYFTEEGFSKSNAILIDDDVRVMIDSGPGKIIDEAKPEHVDLLVNSHCHLDHVWDNDRFINAKILLHPEEREHLKDIMKIVPLENWNRLMDEKPDAYLNLLLSAKDSFLGEWRVDGTINEGDIISAGKTEFQVLHTPGHTSGHLSFFFPGEGLLFCGDICLSKVGPWYGDDDSPLDVFMKSIDRIIDMKPDKVVSGHNREIMTENIRETFEEYRGRIYRREKRILDALRIRPLSIDEMASMFLIYPAHTSIFVLYWEKAMLVKHLRNLIDKGMAEEAGDKKFIIRK